MDQTLQRKAPRNISVVLPNALDFSVTVCYNHTVIKLLFPLPRVLTIAFSGGVDSVAIADFLSRKHDVDLAYFHHGTDTCTPALDFVSEFAHSRGLRITAGFLRAARPPEHSHEEHWRNERYKFLDHFETVVTGHHLDDAVETYLHSALNGTAKVIPSHRGNVSRPFLTTRKQDLVNWCQQNDLSWYEDTSNRDAKFTRNYIREHLMPHAVKVNPGLHSMVRKIITKQTKPA